MTDQQERPEKRPAYKILLTHLKYHAQRMIADARSGDPASLGQAVSSVCTTLILQIMVGMQILDKERQKISESLKSIAIECKNKVLSDEISRLAETILQETWTEETFILVFEDNPQELVYPKLYTDKEEAEDARDKWNADIPACAIRAAIVVPI